MTDTLEVPQIVETEPVPPPPDAEPAEPAEPSEPVLADPLAVRVVIAVAMPTLAAAIMLGGSFTGAGARVYASIAALLGIGLAVAVRRIARPWVAYAAIAGGLVVIGLLMVIPSGPGSIGSIGTLVREAAQSRSVLRPPVDLTPGWQAILGWTLGTLGFVAAWIAIAIDRPSLGLLLPLPAAGVGGINLPDDAQVPSGMVVLVLLALGIGVLASARTVGQDDAPAPLSHELRRAFRAMPLVAVITVVLYFLAEADFLFPQPYIDPAQEPQKPKTIPLSEVEDRVLFEVSSRISGPWRIGSLDVYDGQDWRLPPFAQSELAEVPRDGVVDPELRPGVRAEFTVAGLGGAVLPGLPNPVGIVAEGPRLAYDARSGNIRIAQGQIQAGLKYTVAAASLPSVDELKAVTGTVEGDIARFTEIGDPPPAVTSLIARAPKTSKWETFDFLRTYVLQNVTATGAGAPKSVTPERVADMLSGSKEGSPFEIVAAQAMLARWAGLPSRIGYGFDGGEQVGDKLQVRPKHGATFVEVYFPGYKWLPVIGTPLKAKATVSNADQQQFDPNVQPSDDIAVDLFLPTVEPGRDLTLDRVRLGLLIAVPAALFLVFLYFLFPALVKAVVRSRRRSAAQAAGPRARIELAYSEWRDALTDFGYAYHSDTPLMLLDRFTPDDEHTELAWLVTRTIWGDLREDVTDEQAAAAEELSRVLRRRLAQAHPGTLRAIALVSRLSLRDPYHPAIDELRGRKVTADA